METPKAVLSALDREPVTLHGVKIYPMTVAHEIAFERSGCSFGSMPGAWSTERVVKAVWLATFPANEVLEAQRKMKDSDVESFAEGLSSKKGLEIVKKLLEVVQNADQMSTPDAEGGGNPTPATGG